MSDKLGLMPKAVKEKRSASDIPAQLVEIDEVRKSIEDGMMTDFIIVGTDIHRQLIFSSYCDDIFAGLGLLEAGKMAFMNQGQE